MIKEIKFTDNAIKQINHLLSQKNNDDFFRIAIKGGGCSGFKYDFSFDKNPKHPIKYNAKIPDWLESIILRAIETDTNKRYHNCSEMLYEMNNPVKVKPYFDKNLSFIQRNEMMVYKVGFIVMFVLNLFQLLMK